MISVCCFTTRLLTVNANMDNRPPSHNNGQERQQQHLEWDQIRQRLGEDVETGGGGSGNGRATNNASYRTTMTPTAITDASRSQQQQRSNAIKSIVHSQMIVSNSFVLLPFSELNCNSIYTETTKPCFLSVDSSSPCSWL